MRRRAAVDGRQVDLFGEPAPAVPAVRRAVKKRVREAEPGTVVEPAPEPPALDPGPAVVRETSMEGMAATLSPAELDAFVAALSDDALASLVVEAVRQTRRRLVRGGQKGRPGGKARPSPLERAAKQLAAELGGREED